MEVTNGKIVAVTENELFKLYLERDMDEVMDFREYMARMKDAGCIVEEG